MTELVDPRERWYEAAARRVVTPGEWISRRVETMHFLADGATRRSVSVDVTVPLEFVELGCLPVAILGKQVLHALDVRDPEGAALSVMNTGEDADLAARMLSTLLTPGPGGGPRRELLSNVVYFTGTAAERDRLLDEVRLVAAPSLVSEAAALAQSLMAGFLFVVILPAGVTAGQRWMVKFAYEEPVSIDGKIFPEPAWTYVTPWWSERYHFEVRAPRPLLVDRLELWSPVSGTTPEEGDEEVRVLEQDGPRGVRVAHVATGGLGTGGDHLVWFTLLAERRGMVTVAWWAVLATLTVFVVPAVGNLLAPDAWRVPTDGTSAALLLLVPAVLATFLAQTGDHEVVAHRLRGARLQLALSGGLLFAAAVVLSGVVRDEWRAPMWYGLMTLAAATFVFSVLWRGGATVSPRVSSDISG